MPPVFYPLTAAQRTYELALQEFKQPQILNLGVCLALKADLHLDTLKRCILLEYQRYQCLRLQFTKPDIHHHARQYLSENATPEIGMNDLSGQTWEEAFLTMEHWTSLPFSRIDSPMNEFTIVRLPDKYYGIYLKIDHMTIDSCGIITLANDIIKLYCHFLYSTPYPPKPQSYETALIKDLASETNTVRQQKHAEFWNRLLYHNEPVYTGIIGRRAYSSGLRYAQKEMNDIRENHISFYLKPESANALSAFCSENRLSMANLLLMGLRTCLSQRNHQEKDITIRTYVSRRSLIRNRTCGGSRVHYYPCRTILEPDITFLEGIYCIQSLQNAIYRHVDFDPLLVDNMLREHYHLPDYATYEGLAFTYQPLPVKLLHQSLKEIPCKTMWFSNGTTIQELYLTVMHNHSDSGLEFYFKYQIQKLCQKDIENFYFSFIDILFRGIEHPEMNIRDFIHSK